MLFVKYVYAKTVGGWVVFWFMSARTVELMFVVPIPKQGLFEDK
jgi:hypothetical protein